MAASNRPILSPLLVTFVFALFSFVFFSPCTAVFLPDFNAIGNPSLVNNLPNGTVKVSLTNTSGVALVSKSTYLHGVFTANLRLPQGFSAGIVTTFFMTSNTGKDTGTRKGHQDEADFEFLGNTESKGIILATNYYADGVGTDTHEEGFNFWFDPGASFHNYTFSWGWDSLTFLVDGTPIRTVARVGHRRNHSIPQNPMELQLSIWDASNWATVDSRGWNVPSNYSLQPFSFFTEFIDLTNTCRTEGEEERKKCENDTQTSPSYDTPLTPDQLNSMAGIRQNYLKYSNIIGCGSRYNNTCTSSPPPAPHPSSAGGGGLITTVSPGTPSSQSKSTPPANAGAPTRGSWRLWGVSVVVTLGAFLVA